MNKLSFVECAMAELKRQYFKPDGLVGIGLALLFSGVFVWMTFGFDFLEGRSTFWQSDADDITQYIAGFNMYFASEWQFPLLAFDALSFPEGTRSTFVDIIPLYSLILKIIIPAGWAPFNPFGVWVAICFALQSVGAWWIARELKVGSWIYLLGLLVLLLTFPALLNRIGHISLMSHWIILFAIALYLRGAAIGLLPWRAWAGLLVSAFYINIYLFVMAGGIYVAAVASVAQSRSFRFWMCSLLPLMGLIISLPLTLFPLPVTGVTQEWGFGYYSMNLLSPFLGGSVVKIHAEVASGQYEGFNYLGLGVIVSIVLALVLFRKSLCELVREHRALVLVVFVCAVYSLSNQVYFGGVQVATIAYPKILDSVTSQFRVSGRFFWPVSYVFVIFSWLAICRKFNSKDFRLIALSLILLQIIDVRGIYAVLQSSLERPPVRHLDAEAWDSVISSQSKVMYFYPKFKCGKYPAHDTLLPVMKYASEKGHKLNTGYIARYTPRCDDVAEEISASNVNDSVYVFVRKEFGGVEDVRPMMSLGKGGGCTEVDFAIICLPKN